jgi:hypothetical protein
VQEFRVVTQNYKAEYQRASGAVVTAATKSGTNEVSGDLFFYGQNRNLLATNYWDQRDNIQRPEYRRGQFGASVGGPIVRDRTHYFADVRRGRTLDLNSRVSLFAPPAGARPADPRHAAARGRAVRHAAVNNLFFGKVDHALT